MNAFIERHYLLLGLAFVLAGVSTVNPHLQTILEAVWMAVCAAAGLVLSLVLGV